jgi:phage terminase large subunit
MARELTLDTPRVFAPLLEPSRYKGAYGGRGSGKSHFFAEALIEQSMMTRGNRAVCIREVQRTLKESSKRLIEDKLESMRLGASDGFKVFNELIQTPGDGVITFQGMQDHNAESIKSLEGFRIAWCEEAQSLSARSLSLLRPTIRADDSELWFSWNPRRKTDPVDEMLRGSEIPTGSIVVKANWQDNPYFPAVLEQERLDCLRLQPDQYDHVWNGGYATVLVGAYYARALAEAQAEGRIGRVAADPLLPIFLFVDIGGTGARADAFTIWAAQFVGREVRVLDYYEAVGQPLGAHLLWLRERKYTPDRSRIWLPHDGETHDSVFAVSYESALVSAGYDVTVVPNQGRGAAKSRIEAGRRIFPACWFNASTTEAGRDALGWYHEKRDEARSVGLGPDHDWSSHGSRQLRPDVHLRRAGFLSRRTTARVTRLARPPAAHERGILTGSITT